MYRLIMKKMHLDAALNAFPSYTSLTAMIQSNPGDFYA